MGLKQVNDLAAEVRSGFRALLITLVRMGDLLASQSPNTSAREDWHSHAVDLSEQGYLDAEDL